MKTYVLTISKNYLSTHPKAGQPTMFFNKIQKGEKLHTIRGNYELWKNRCDSVNEGRAIISLREWSGKPYNSPQVELKKFDKIGCQKLEHDVLGWFIDSVDTDFTVKDFAPNDGLTVDDFKAWFKKYPTKPMAIIHFTDFRY